eukprot:UN04213
MTFSHCLIVIVYYIIYMVEIIFFNIKLLLLSEFTRLFDLREMIINFSESSVSKKFLKDK